MQDGANLILISMSHLNEKKGIFDVQMDDQQFFMEVGKGTSLQKKVKGQ